MFFSATLPAEQITLSGLYTWGFEASEFFSCDEGKKYIAVGEGLREYSVEIKNLAQEQDWNARVDYVVFVGTLVEGEVWSTTGVGDRKIIVHQILLRTPHLNMPCEGFQNPQALETDSELF